VDAVVALNPAPAHLPALFHVLSQNDADFTVMLQRIQRQQYRSKPRPARNPEQSIRASYPGLWKQL
jgi:hypothetical protein